MSSADLGERAATVALAALPGIGPATLAAVREHPGAPATWAAVREGRASSVPAIAAVARRHPGGDALASIHRAAVGLDPGAYLRAHEELGVRVLLAGDGDYPARLAADPAPPTVLFAVGALAALEGPTVAIVGTRNATQLGCETAARLAAELTSAGVGVVSGLALGIDGAAHRAVVSALEDAGPNVGLGRPVGVVAAGLDRRYPRRHARLHDEVARRGLVVSEVPLGVPPSRWRFPARNRIIAGLAEALVVVESRSAGGSMLTVGDAIERDRPVLAVPGHPSAPASAGTLDLICEGAVPLRDVEDVLVAIGRGGTATRPTAAAPDPTPATPLEQVLADLLGGGPANLAELVHRSGASVAATSEALVGLERAGLIVRTGAWFERRGAAATGERS